MYMGKCFIEVALKKFINFQKSLRKIAVDDTNVMTSLWSVDEAKRNKTDILVISPPTLSFRKRIEHNIPLEIYGLTTPLEKLIHRGLVDIKATLYPKFWRIVKELKEVFEWEEF